MAPFDPTGDSQGAIDYLSGSGRYRDRGRFPLPEVILLDLKMPRISGFEVLQWIRSRTEFKSLPIFVLSSSDYPEHIQKVQAMGGDSFFLKTHDYAAVIARIKLLFGGHLDAAADSGIGLPLSYPPEQWARA